MHYLPTIGLEIHIELKTKTKMFCRCINDPFARDPNKYVCPVCLGLPGALPYPNKEAVLKTIQFGKSLHCEIAEFSKWDRKNYFYPDLPKGYQISQYDLPLARNGLLELKTQNSKLKTIRIRRVHLEEDTGKLLHHAQRGNRDAQQSHTKDGYSLIDYNRSGVPLMELVTEPDIQSAIEARKFAEEIQLILRHIGISEANMEKGEMRVEANVSLSLGMFRSEPDFASSSDSASPTRSTAPSRQQAGTKLAQSPLVSSLGHSLAPNELGTKVEIKNLNSFRSVERAIEFELKRQQEVLEKGEQVIQETRGWDDTKQITYSQRVKETEGDYRYFPEPDIPPLKLEMLVELEKLAILETPSEKRTRYSREYGLSDKEAETILSDQKRMNIFEQVPDADKQTVSRLIINHPKILERSIDEIIKISHVPIFQQKRILETGEKLNEQPIKTENYNFEEIIKKVLLSNQKAVNDYKSGKKQALGFLIGQIARQTKGSVDPNEIKSKLEKQLNG